MFEVYVDAKICISANVEGKHIYIVMMGCINAKKKALDDGLIG